MADHANTDSVSLLGLMTSLGVGGVLRALVYTVAGTLMFGVVGYLAFVHGPGSVESGWSAFWRLLFALLIIPAYTLTGGAAGLVWAITGTILGHADRLETLLNRMVNPMMAILVQKLSPGERGIPVPVYLAHLDEKMAGLQRVKSGLRGPSLWLFGVILKLFRRFAAERLLRDLQDRKEHEVTNASLERFIREGLVSYLKEEFEDQLTLWRYGIVALLGLMTAYPAYRIIF